MQRYKIIHRTHYNYDDEVTLGQQQLLLRPREDHELRIESFELVITPTAKLLWHRDIENNSVAIATFRQTTQQLLIESEVVIQQYNESPLDFLVADYALSYPFSYQQEDSILLDPYRALPIANEVAVIKPWIDSFWQANEAIETYSLLQRLTSHIHQTLSYRVREEPGVQSASHTLGCGNGSCRDFAWLFMQAVRCLGLASRFVSGYLYAPMLSEKPGATHAWSEVYLPGAGWKGFDPTIGKIVGSDHIPVAVSRLAESVPPVGGSYVGSDKSTLNVGVWVSKC